MMLSTLLFMLLKIVVINIFTLNGNIRFIGAKLNSNVGRHGE